MKNKTTKEMNKETLNAIMVLTFFFGGLLLMVVGFLLNPDGTIFYVGMGFFAAALVIGVFEFLGGRERGK